MLPPQKAEGQATGPWARGVEGQRKADLGNGTLLNPIMAGDHPVRSTFRDGDDYYMTCSSQVPGAAVGRRGARRSD